MIDFIRNIDQIDFARPEMLYLLLIIPLMIAWYIYKYSMSQPAIQVSATEPFIRRGRSWRLWLIHLLFVFRLLAIALIIFAIARPQSSLRRQDITVEGIDIVIAFDIDRESVV